MPDVRFAPTRVILYEDPLSSSHFRATFSLGCDVWLMHAQLQLQLQDCKWLQYVPFLLDWALGSPGLSRGSVPSTLSRRLILADENLAS